MVYREGITNTADAANTDMYIDVCSECLSYPGQRNNSPLASSSHPHIYPRNSNSVVKLLLLEEAI